MEFYLERNNKDRDMIEIFTKTKSGKVYTWGMCHVDFVAGEWRMDGILDYLDDGPVKVKMEIIQ